MRHVLWLRYIQARTFLVWVLSRVYVRVSLFICAPALADLRERIRHLDEDIDDLQSQIDRLDTEYVERSDFDSLERDVEDLRDTVDNLDRDMAEVTRNLDEVKDNVETIKEDIDAA